MSDELIASIQDAVRGLSHSLAALEEHLAELQHDVAAIADLAGRVMGEPFSSQARSILSRRDLRN